MTHRRRLFAASCAALVSNAMAFSVRTDIMGDFERVFQLTKVRAGEAVLWGAIGGTIILFTGGALLDFVGAGVVFWLAFAAHVAGVSTVIFAQGFWSLAIGWLFLALGSGLTHAVINPLAATLYPERKTHVFAMLHAWWPGGLVLGGLLAFGLGWLFGLDGMPAFLGEHGWQIKMACAYVPIALYAVLILGQQFPKTERVQAGVSTGAMFREALRPMFLLLVFCMCLTASVELGFNTWVGVFIKDIASFPGVLVLVYISGLMFLVRTFAAPLAKRISPMRMLLGSSVLAGLGLLWLSCVQGVAMVFLAATVFGVGVCYFWPTMLGTTAERFPKGGAFLLAVIGGVGGLFLSYVTGPGMGWLHDRYTRASLPDEVRAKVVVKGRVDEEVVKTLPDKEKEAVVHAKRTAASTTFRYLAVMAAVLVVLFGAISLYDRTRRKAKPAVESGPPPP